MLEASSVRARHGEKEATCSVVDAAGADAVRPRERAAERSAHWYVAPSTLTLLQLSVQTFVGITQIMHAFEVCTWVYSGFSSFLLLSKKKKKTVQYVVCD